MCSTRGSAFEPYTTLFRSLSWRSGRGAVVAGGVVVGVGQLVVGEDVAHQAGDLPLAVQRADVDADHGELHQVGVGGEDLDGHEAAVGDAADATQGQKGPLHASAQFDVVQRLSHLPASPVWLLK